MHRLPYQRCAKEKRPPVKNARVGLATRIEGETRSTSVSYTPSRDHDHSRNFLVLIRYIVGRSRVLGGMMNKLLAMMLCFALPISLFAGENSYKVTYDGGSLTDAKAGTGMKLIIEATQVRLVKDKTDVVTIPASAVTEVSYGQDVHRRVGAAIGLAVVSFGVGALMALTKSKKHYVGLTWADGDKKGGFAMQCDKNDYRGVLAGLEGVTGKKAVDSDAMTVKN